MTSRRLQIVFPSPGILFILRGSLLSATISGRIRQTPRLRSSDSFLRQELPGNASVETIISFLEKRWGRLSPPVPCSAPAKAFDRSTSTISFKGEKENVATIA